MRMEEKGKTQNLLQTVKSISIIQIPAGQSTTGFHKHIGTQCEDFLENAYVSFDWKFLKLPIFKTLFCKIEVYDGRLQG